ncbi:MAG TPA: DUF1579 domain-containing protein [Chitinophagaceae bacterium]|nr:DUF1579 domain-containing protein [Chitinophagaceae bacterium]
MSQNKFEASKTNGVHHKLSQIAGEWEGTTAVYFEGTTPVDEAPVTATIRPVLDGRFMLHEYKASFQGKPLEGIALYGYDLASEKFQCAWADSFHMSTGIMFSQDSDPSKLFQVLGSYAAGDQQWGWRTEIEMPDENELNIIATNLMPDGSEAGGVKTRYKRKS